MAARYEIHRGTTESFRVTLRRSSGAPIPLAGATGNRALADFWMAPFTSDDPLVDYAEAVVLEGLVIPPDDREFNEADPERAWPKGVVEYRWAPGETAEPGLYRVRFRVTSVAGDVAFVPNEDDFTLVIN
jgi:hypothetical protein